MKTRAIRSRPTYVKNPVDSVCAAEMRQIFDKVLNRRVNWPFCGAEAAANRGESLLFECAAGRLPKATKRARRTGARRALFGDAITRDQASAVTRLVSRENLRAAVFLCSTPLATPRASSG